MEWLEARLYTTSEGIEPVCAMLLEAGVDGVEIEDDADMKNFLGTNADQWDYVDDELLNKPNGEACVKFYLTANAAGSEILLSVKNGVEFIRGVDAGVPLGRLALLTRSVDDSDWIDNWKKYFKPLEIGRNIVVKPVWEDYSSALGKTVFNINPGHVFGTGLHQTTQLCIEELEKHVRGGMNVLDIGCGTGILSVISMMLGASRATAIDTDRNAVDIAYENAELNGIDRARYDVLAGNVISDDVLRGNVSRRDFDIVVANIVADVIIALAPIIPGCMKPGGVFISSGIIGMRLEEVKTALLSQGFEIADIRAKDDWLCVVCRHA